MKACHACGVPQAIPGLTDQGFCRDYAWCERTRLAGGDGDPVPRARVGRSDPGRECVRCNATFYSRGTASHCDSCSEFLNTTIRRWSEADQVVRLPAEEFAAHLGITVDVLDKRISRMRAAAR